MKVKSRFKPCVRRGTKHYKSLGAERLEDQDVPYMSYSYETSGEIVFGNFGKGPCKILASIVEALEPLYGCDNTVMWYTIVLSPKSKGQTSVRVSVATDEDVARIDLALLFQAEIDRLLCNV